MRVVLVGTVAARDRLREHILDGMEIVGEVPSVAAARSAGFDADAWLLANVEQDDDVVETLTPRETEVLELLAQGLSNKAIAARLSISDQTVKFHVASICGKLGASNRTDAVRRGLRRGLTTL